MTGDPRAPVDALVVDALARATVRRAREPSAAWFHQIFERTVAGALDQPRFFGAFAGAGRRLGTHVVELDADESASLGALSPLPDGWALDELGRATLLLAAVSRAAATVHVALVREAIQKGDVREQTACLKSLAWLPDPQRFVDLAVDACRSNVEPVFESIACDNPFVAGHFSELQFNQLVLKALFIGSPARRIRGLVERASTELGRMVAGYASERAAAGRSISDDVRYVRGLCGDHDETL